MGEFIKGEDHYKCREVKAERDQLRNELEKERGRVKVASMVISDLDYAAYNLCKNTSEEDITGVIESTCPERSLYIAIRDLKQALSADEGGKQEETAND